MSLKGVFIATQLNSTELNWPSWTAYSQVSRVFVYDVTTYKLSQLLFTLSSWVELCRYKHPSSRLCAVTFANLCMIFKMLKSTDMGLPFCQTYLWVSLHSRLNSMFQKMQYRELNIQLTVHYCRSRPLKLVRTDSPCNVLFVVDSNLSHYLLPLSNTETKSPETASLATQTHLRVSLGLIPWEPPYEIRYPQTRVLGLPQWCKVHTATFSYIDTERTKAQKSLFSHN